MNQLDEDVSCYGVGLYSRERSASTRNGDDIFGICLYSVNSGGTHFVAFALL